MISPSSRICNPCSIYPTTITALTPVRLAMSPHPLSRICNPSKLVSDFLATVSVCTDEMKFLAPSWRTNMLSPPSRVQYLLYHNNRANGCYIGGFATLAKPKSQKSVNFVEVPKLNIMKGIRYITDDHDRKTAVVIDLKTIENNEEEVHEFIDVLIAESRKGDEQISWSEAKKILQKDGKL